MELHFFHNGEEKIMPTNVINRAKYLVVNNEWWAIISNLSTEFEKKILSSPFVSNREENKQLKKSRTFSEVCFCLNSKTTWFGTNVFHHSQNFGNTSESTCVSNKHAFGVIGANRYFFTMSFIVACNAFRFQSLKQVGMFGGSKNTGRIQFTALLSW